MGRPKGSRNAGYDARREAIARTLAEYLSRLEGGTRTSLRELAQAASISVATLRHYFGDREGALEAAYGELSKMGQPYLQQTARGQLDLGGHVRASLEWALTNILIGWRRFGVGKLHETGFAEGLGDERLGPAYVELLLEPTLQATEARLAEHMRRGDLRKADPRGAALTLLGPLMLGLLHQDGLGGAACRPLDLEAFVPEHVATFLRAYDPEPQAAAPALAPEPQSKLAPREPDLA